MLVRKCEKCDAKLNSSQSYLCQKCLTTHINDADELRRKQEIQEQKNKRVVIVLSLLDALYPENCIMVNKDREEIVIKHNEDGLIIPFEACRTMLWEKLRGQIDEFMKEG